MTVDPADAVSETNEGDSFMLTEGDLEVRENEHKSQTSTVLMIDISHSMILYGEDRITPAKKVAMALAELVKQKYPKDFLDVIVFGNDAWQIEVKDLPYLQVGTYHTNTVAGLASSLRLAGTGAQEPLWDRVGALTMPMTRPFCDPVPVPWAN